MRSPMLLLLLLVGLWLLQAHGRLNPRVVVLPKKNGALSSKASMKGPSSLPQSSVSPSTSSPPRARFRVVTDIDDTVKSSGGKNIFGVYLGGVDTQFKRGTFYPGAFQFSWELSKYNRMLKEAMVPKVAVLTARAREFKFALALKPTTKIVKRFRRQGLAMGTKDWGIGDVLYGSVVEWVLQERKGIRKFNNFKLLLDKDERLNGGRKQRYVFIGDTGEKDEEAGVSMINTYPDRMRAMFLHVVADTKDHTKVVPPSDRTLKGVPIFYYRTYVGAAVKAYSAGLLDKAGVRRVVKVATAELKRIDPPRNGATRGTSSRWVDLEKDIQLSRRVMSQTAWNFANPLEALSRNVRG